MDGVRQTTIRFSPEMSRRLEHAGIRTGLPLNSIVTVACMEWLERHLPERLEDSAPVRGGGLLEKLRPGRRGRTGRLTPGAQNVLSLAQDEAGRLNHSHLGTEHLLLGLVIDQDSLAGQVLAELGVDPQGVRQQLEAVVGPGTCSTKGGAGRARPGALRLAQAGIRLVDGLPEFGHEVVEVMRQLHEDGVVALGCSRGKICAGQSGRYRPPSSGAGLR